MATIAAPRPRWQADRRFFTGIAVAMVAATFVGFAPTYYLGSFTNAPALDPLVHVHGVLFSVWMLLFLMQNGLVAARRTDVHRLTGIALLAVAAAVVIVGVAVAIHSGRLGHGPPDRDQHSFLAFPMANMLLFAAFTALGFVFRRRSEYHKRLMLLATLGLVITPLARISGMLGLPFHPNAIGGMILSDFFFAALVIFDLRRHGRLHPATLWAGGAFLASQPLRVMIGQTDAWQAFARSLIG